MGSVATTRDAGMAAAVDALHAATALYTAMPVVEALLDRMGWPDADGRLLDPSAGDGSFLVAALSRIDTAPGDMAALDRVQGHEMHPEAAAEARTRVAALLVSRGWDRADAGAGARRVVHEGDFLTAGVTGGFRFVAGNPPYIRWGRLPAPLKQAWAPVLTDVARGDLMHAFIERTVGMMPSDGVVGLVTSDRWLINETTSPLRAAVGRKAGVSHLARLDAGTAFYQPKTRRRSSPPRVHPVEVVLRPVGGGLDGMCGRPLSPDGAGEEAHDGPTLADVAEVRLAPWLGPKGVFLMPAGAAAGLVGADLVPAIDTDDIEPGTDVLRAPSRVALRTRRDAEPGGTVREHLLAARDRLPARARAGKWWMPPEAITLPLDRPCLMVPRIGRRLRAVRVPAGVLPVNHNLCVSSVPGGPSLDEIERALTCEASQAWAARHAPRLEDGFLAFRAGLLRRLPVA